MGLGLGLLGSSLSLPFGLYVILCQRAAEKYIQARAALCCVVRRVLGCAAACWACLCCRCAPAARAPTPVPYTRPNARAIHTPPALLTRPTAPFTRPRPFHPYPRPCHTHAPTPVPYTRPNARAIHTPPRPLPSVQDNVSPVSESKRTATAVAVLTAILVLVPMAPEVAASIGLGKVDSFF